ncbi:ATP-dependent DNA helicase pif1 [Gigaspora margarita]|uniref:ATP-dependent DNA helicase pif1 n=1 Tax=Gigaspora margarita TaxID=4874 RepID=A0A8H4AXX9_GIGMA|nr:ATP-dependent DNA helicase pif1 [Gigaspora margarita]
MFFVQTYFITPKAFIFNNKAYKTCANCLIARFNKKAEKWPLPSDNDFESTNSRTETQLENDTKEIAFINLIEYVYNKFSNLEEGSGISFNLHIELDDNTLINVHHDTKLLVKLIVDEIEEDDGFTTGPTNSVRHSGVNIAAKEAKVKFNHDIQHEKPVDVTTPEEIKCEIMHNLHMDPMQLRTHLRQRFDALQVTPKQIITGDNSNNNGEFCYEWNDESVTAIGFITPLITELLPVSSIHCNVIYKTTKGRFELYGIISSVHGAGFPVVYLMLNTTNASDNAQTGLRTKALTGFLSLLCNKGLQLQHFYTDKNFAQINAAKEIWSNINVQLCL